MEKGTSHKSMEILRLFVEHAPCALAMFDREMRFLLVSRRWRTDYGLGDRDLLGILLYDVFPELPEACRDDHRRGLNGEVLQSAGDRFERTDGSVQWIKWEIRPWFDDSEKVGGIILFTEDITRQKSAEEALCSSEEQFRIMFMQSSVGKVMVDPTTGRFLKVNPAYCQITGYTEDQLLQKSFTEITHPEDRDATQVNLKLLILGKITSFKTEKRYLRPDGTVAWAHVTVNLVRDTNGQPLHTLAVVQDISERRQAENDLAASEKKYRELLETANSIIIRWDSQGIIRYVNEFGLRFFGYSRQELLGQRILKLVPEIEGSSGRDHSVFVKNILKHPEQHPFVLDKNIRKDGKLVWVSWTNKAIVDERGDVQEILAIGNDVTAQKEAEAALRLSEERFRTLNRSMIQPMAFHEIICDASGNPIDYRFLDVNPAFEKLLGKTAADIVGKTVLDISPDTEAHWIETYGKVALSGEPLHFENYSQGLERHLDIVVFSPARGQFAVIITDISERVRMREEKRRFEEQIFHAQKLESLGILAGGIAHDFNNILMSVLGNADLALRRIAPESPAMDNIRQIEQAAGRAADLARQMLAYSGKGHFVVETLNLDKLIQEMTHILQVSISKQAVIRFNFHPNLPAVEGDATQLRQVIMNLVINSSEAIGERSGVIAISTGAMDCDRDYLKSTFLNEDLAEGMYVFIEVADTGCGMDKHTLNHLFDPFFSTKFTGRGLGMAAVLGIVRGHKGAIKVYSEQGKGSTFKVLFPASTRSETFYDSGKTETIWQGTGTILLVDDEETVRAIGKDMLQELGLEVLTASDGREALELFRKKQQQINCVLMDLTMPHMDGAEAFRELRRIDPAVKIIMASGYNEQEVGQKFIGKGLSGFIQKPYRISELAEVLRSLDDSSCD